MRLQVIIPAPFWVSYPEMARLAGAEAVVVPSTASEGFQPSVQRLQASITARSRLLILCSPSNPSGAVLPLELLQAHPQLPSSLIWPFRCLAMSALLILHPAGHLPPLLLLTCHASLLGCPMRQ